MKTNRFFFFIFFSLFSFFSFAQHYLPDSLVGIANNLSGIKKVDALNVLCREYVYYDYNKIVNSAKEALALSKKENYTKGEGEALINFGVLYSLSGLYDTSNYYFNQGITTLTINADSTTLIYAKVEKAFYCNDNNLLEVLQRSNQYAITKSDKSLESFIISKFGIYFINNQKYIAAIASLDKAIFFYSQTKNIVREVDCLIKKAEAFYKMKNLILSYKTAIYASSLAKNYQLPYSELCCEKFLYSFYYNSGNFKNALSSLIALSKIQDEIRKFEIDIVLTDKKKEQTILESRWNDSIKKVAIKTKAETTKKQKHYNQWNSFSNPYTAASIITFVLLLITSVLLWRSSKTNTRLAATIKKLELELTQLKSQESSALSKGQNKNESLTIKNQNNDAQIIIKKEERLTFPSIKIPDRFFVCANQTYFNKNRLLWTRHEDGSNLDFVVLLSNVNKLISQDFKAELNKPFENNEGLLKSLLSIINKEVASLPGAESCVFCLNESLFYSVSGCNIYLWVSRGTGKKGLKINGRQLLPKKISQHASLYEIYFATTDPFVEIKDIQLEKGDRIYLTTTSCYDKICEALLHEGSTVESYILGITALPIEEQEVGISKIKNNLKEENDFIFMGCLL